MRGWISKAIVKAGRSILKTILIKTSPIWGTLLAMFAVAWICYYMIFEAPKQAIRGLFTGNDRESAFEYGRGDPDREIFEKYRTVAAQWNAGLTPEQQTQVDSFALDWEWLAAVDRTLGDPQQAGIRDAKELKLDPEATFELVRPKFEWKEAEKEIDQQSCVQIKQKDEKGDEMTRYEIQSSTTRQPQILLKQAQTMQGVYVYSYRTKTSVTKSPSACGELATTETYQALSGITAVENEWQPLKQILRDHGFPEEKDQDFLLEYWLSFLADPDGSEYDPLPEDWEPIESELLWPLPEKGRVSSQFGVRIHPITGERKMHNGVDVAVPKGTEVYAAEDGKVIHAGFLGTAGLAVIIDHGGLETRYFHLSSVKVDQGQTVRRGDLIGLVGATGEATGPHLHFETRVGGEPVDPLSFFGGGTKE
ncbi:M23 family metallopeptidase [Cohnella thermotolerans]|uniref:M23 family metallopeptidase n=1 Tax=Cohnella thermotolerans TaxID=329858 RepID=UPI00040EAD67|nr:M23 family metallopeptidase [Cohnella thermotolerans]